MRLKAFSLLLFFVFQTLSLSAQVTFSGVVVDQVSNKPIANIEIYNKTDAKTSYANNDGSFSITANSVNAQFVFITEGFEFFETQLQENISNKIALKPLAEELSEVVIDQQRAEIFGIKNLKDVEGTAIYAGKKTEVILVEQTMGNKASGNPRQAYAQIAGLNIYETDDAGLQLNIGGRGLDPNRSSNFNTRQNGYDISADVLGYPESYYTPPLEATDEIQIIRGAASLQYGTQFGGLVNFKLKQPNPTKKIELVTRQGGGSFGLINSFTSLSGTVGKASYYTYFQYKKGDGFRPNSNFDSKNVYANVGYQFTDKTKLTFESTYLNYLAQQAGGLTDLQFQEDPTFSNRTRNYFNVDWVLLNLKLEHEFSYRSRFSINIFRLDAFRKALGFRDSRPSVDDTFSFRELIVDEFNNWGTEARFLTKYDFFDRNSVFLIGAKYYQSDNESQQGVGSDRSDADFNFYSQFSSSSELTESEFNFPNLNLSVFAENIFNITDAFSVTPGARFEYIKTEANGFFIDKDFDFAGNFLGQTIENENRTNERSFVLLGVGLSYKSSSEFELFANFSQNYRSVTFTDIRIDNPNLLIDENISDERGFTADMGIRGAIDNIFRYDISVFSLLYDNRIGLVDFDGSKLIRKNIGTAQIFGGESLVALNASNLFFPNNKQFHWQHYINTAYTFSEYVDSEEEGIIGNEVEFIPKLNLKTGVELGYKNFKSSLQYTYVSTQFTDAANSSATTTFEQFGTIGEIPTYQVLDISLEYTFKKFKLETGVNNVLNESYFTRRATGYPGPGIIPSNSRNFYAVLQFKL